MAQEPPGTASPRVTPEGIYGCLAVAVVCIAWEGEHLGELALEIAIYSLTLWLFHIYARVVHSGWTHRSAGGLVQWARHEWPHVEAAVPALVVVGLGWASGWAPKSTSDLALGVTIANLLILQVAAIYPGRPSRHALLFTLLVDAVVLAALLWLRLAVK